MKPMKMCVVCTMLALSLDATAQSQGSVTIRAPADGAVLDVMEQNTVDYQVVPGPGGDHVHLYVDGEETAILRALAGSYPLDSLSPGKHSLCVKVVNKNHTPIGVEQCVAVTVQ